ncbi:MAG: gluconate 2-dehydrogenase subunit 3 family protein [Deltaproteobacteria bacterium]|nr:gluconate 2-dehydrogenase subunit 3 family protein [Deltaproteobacteria bacterium]
MFEISRRTFLGGAVTLVCAPPLAGCDEPVASSSMVDGWVVPAGTKLSPSRYATLAALADTLIPGDVTSPGATLARAAWYIDQFLGAFDVDPPRIYAGGPYSGRHGGLNGFAEFLPLTRVEALSFRTLIEGSRGIPEREWNGPVKGLIQTLEEGLDELEAVAADRTERSFRGLSLEDRRGVLTGFDAELLKVVYRYVVEGTYGDPVYGGNFELSGWKSIRYEGDRHPLGFNPLQLMQPEDGDV